MMPWFKPGELVCPSCGVALARSPIGGDLECVNGHNWPSDGIPRLVPTGLNGAVASTIASFRFKWAHDPMTTAEERQRVATSWFYDRFNLGYDEYMDSGDESGMARLLKGKRRILDAGCGLGNMTSVFSRLAPQAQIWGLDLSPSVNEIQRIYGEMGNVRLVQGDLCQMPITGTFDLIVADGVLHHTASTRTAFHALADRLRPGGEFLFYVYRVKAPVREFSDDWLRQNTTKMDPEECMDFCRALTDLGRQLREAGLTLRFEKDIPLLGIKAGEIDLQRWVYWHILKCFWDDGGNVIASHLENFDWYHPEIAHRHTPEEVAGWVSEAGLEMCNLAVGDSGISAWTRRVPK